MDSFWTDNSASDLFSRYWNDWNVMVERLEGKLPLLMTSPYDSPLSFVIKQHLRSTLGKQPVDYENLDKLVDSSSPALLVSTEAGSTAPARQTREHV